MCQFWLYFFLYNTPQHTTSHYIQLHQTYISEMLVALNPNKSMHELYSWEMIKKYKEVSFGVLPSHVFAIG